MRQAGKNTVGRSIATVVVTAAAIGALAGWSTKPADSQLDNVPYVTSYADPAPKGFEMQGDRMDPYADEAYASEETHILNDAWLGLSVISEDGVNLGYVTDAFIDENGNMSELVVVPADADSKIVSTPVYVPAQHASLGGNAVNVDITAEGFATLEPATEYASLTE